MERNGRTNTDLGLIVEERPNIPAPNFRTEKVKIPGRDGEMVINKGIIEDITITVSFAFLCKPDKWQERFREARRWLLENKDNRLLLSDNDGFYYKVKETIIGTGEREARRIGKFEAEFLCNGYEYLIAGTREYDIKDVLYNPYYLSKPIFLISGEGMCDLKVNGNKMQANVGQNLTIDTDLMIAYRIDGEMANTDVTGDYEDLYLQEGDNQIEITDGFEMKIIPNWRCL